jgi:tRNA1Val (adenine37-N6)-methyltransferase
MQTGLDITRGLLRPGERIDDLQRSGLHIIQDPGRFCFGMDAVLLSGFATAPDGGRVLDLGTGTGIIPLLLFAKTKAGEIAALEIQEESADMAARSVRLNHLEEKIHIVNGDIRETDAYFAPASFDVVTCNPPYMIGTHGLANPSDAKAIARHEVLCTFDDVARAAARMLKSGGHFYLVHRPFRLVELFETLTRYQLEPKRMQLVYPYADREPNMVLLDCTRGGNRRLTVEKPIIVYRSPGEYTDEIRDIYGY